MIKKILFGFVVLMAALSCTKLDETLYDKIPENKFPENENQIKLIPLAVYVPLRDFLDDPGCWWYAQEVTSDEMVCPTRNTDWADGGKWTALYTHTWNNKTQAVENMWPKFYNGVLEANKAIESLNAITAMPATKAIIAQVKVMRAYYYYLLIDNYGSVPYVTIFTGAPANPEKTSRAEIFNNIVKDIEDNVQYLKPMSSKIMVGKGMAFSLLAKLYINSEVYTGVPQWEKAEAACDSVLSLGYKLESDPLAPFITANENSTENIFTIPFNEDNYKGFNLHMRTLHYDNKSTFNMTVQPWNGFAVTESHFNTYEDIDKRKKGFLFGQQYDANGAELTDNTAKAKLVLNPHIAALVMDKNFSATDIRMGGARVKKFEIKMGAKDNLSNDYPLFRLGDIILMKAETMIRQGKNGDSYVNQIRKRAGVADFTNTTLDQLLAERGREMFWEAQRRQDLIRFGKFNDAWWEKPADSPDRNTFPIPQKQIDGNPNLAK